MFTVFTYRRITIPARRTLGTDEHWYAHIVGRSPALSDAIALASQIAASRSVTVLLVGETGTGKELFARGIHAASTRAADPFVAINCAAIPETLLESELFGHEAGAFTDARSLKLGLFEVAAAGTIFLDEVAELPLKLQAKLLRVVEEKKFRRLGGSEERTLTARILAGSNTSLDQAVAQNHFRADLFYRLNVARIELPPLRERVGDVRLLAEYFISRHSEGPDSRPLELAPESIRALETHHWPGNIRELKNVIERAAVVCTGSVIEPVHLSLQRRSYVPVQGSPSGSHIEIPPQGKTLKAITSEAINLTIDMLDGNVSAAARQLGISRPTLARKLKEDGVVRQSILRKL